MFNQQQIEEKFNPKTIVLLPGDSTVEDAYGPMKDWLLKLGDYQFLLDPIKGNWLYYDRVHKTWDITGYKAGEVIFSQEKGELYVRPTPEPTFWESDRRYYAAEQRFHVLWTLLQEGLIEKEVFSESVSEMTLKDRQGNLWRLGETDGRWTYWNGNTWAEGSPDQENLPSPQQNAWIKFAQLRMDYFALKLQLENGQLNDIEFDTEVNKLRVQDGQSAWWQLRASDGAWLYWNGSTWVERRPINL